MHSQSYPVTAMEKPPEQPHLQKSMRKVEPPFNFISWCPCITAGIIALTTILCIHFLGGSKLFPTHVNLFENLIPIVKRGKLDLEPFDSGISTGIKEMYSSNLPPSNLTGFINSIQALLDAYPRTASTRYRQCWLENPDFDHPCYFDPAWISNFCSEKNFGYEAADGTFTPCFIIKISDVQVQNKSGNWIPLLHSESALTPSLRQNYDPGFMPVLCQTMYENGTITTNEISTFPPKGFSHLYFPMDKFDPKYYLHPLVAVKPVIEQGQNVTIQCSILAQNAFMLWDNGVINVSFNQ